MYVYVKWEQDPFVFIRSRKKFLETPERVLANFTILKLAPTYKSDDHSNDVHVHYGHLLDRLFVSGVRIHYTSAFIENKSMEKQTRKRNGRCSLQKEEEWTLLSSKICCFTNHQLVSPVYLHRELHTSLSCDMCVYVCVRR